MEYFKRLQQLLNIEKEEDRRSFKDLTEKLPIQERRENGLTWFPIAIKDTELGKGDYVTVEVERTTHQDIIHRLHSGSSSVQSDSFNRLPERWVMVPSILSCFASWLEKSAADVPKRSW